MLIPTVWRILKTQIRRVKERRGDRRPRICFATSFSLSPSPSYMTKDKIILGPRDAEQEKDREKETETEKDRDRGTDKQTERIFKGVLTLLASYALCNILVQN